MNSTEPFEVTVVWNHYPGAGIKNDLDLIFLTSNITLEKILQFEVQRDFTRKINQKYSLPFGSELIYLNEEILSYIIIFIASSIARYKPVLWKKVISGADKLC